MFILFDLSKIYSRINLFLSINNVTNNILENKLLKLKIYKKIKTNIQNSLSKF